MAPRKTTASNKTLKVKKTPVAKKSEDKIIKRPARGYHKFRNGLLNVTPKDGEKELAKQNQTSLLLRLPPEIRNVIWQLVLGGKMCRTVSRKFESSPLEPINAMALLRTCRQIYAEAALIPLTLTTLSIDEPHKLKSALNGFKPYQRQLITSITLKCRAVQTSATLRSFKYHAGIERLLPNLQEIRVLVFSASEATSVEPTEELVRKSMTVKVEQAGQSWLEYDNLWRGVVRKADDTVKKID